jgi:hypothetical protein
MIFSKRCPHQALENYLISWWDLYSGRLYILDDILQEMSTPGIRKLLDHGGICTQVDYTYWMIFSKRCPHQTSRKLLDIMVGFVLR